MNAHLRRIEAVNPQINAVVQLTADAARKEAHKADAALARGEIKGPLHGVPMTIKDSIETAGVISTSGTKGRASFVPTQDATVVTRLRVAGAILLGKTNVPEMAMAAETDNLVYGRTNNPYDLTRTSGGSTGGEGAIIAAGGSPLGLGSDAGGSVRVPCHYCGIAGMKPTTGRVPITGHFPPTDGAGKALWQLGPMARFVEDLTLILSIIAGVDWRDQAVVPMPLGDPQKVDIKGLRISFHTENGIASPSVETVDAVKAAAKSLSDAAISVEEDRPECIEETLDLILGVIGEDGGSGIEALLKRVGTAEIHPLLERFLELMRRYEMSTFEFEDLLARIDVFRGAMISFMENYDVIISPVNGYPALPHGVTFDDDKLPALSYTFTYNLTGWPAVVVRGGTSPEGLPIGVQVVGRPWREDMALAVAQHVETALGGFKPPPI